MVKEMDVKENHPLKRKPNLIRAFLTASILCSILLTLYLFSSLEEPSVLIHNFRTDDAFANITFPTFVYMIEENVPRIVAEEIRGSLNSVKLEDRARYVEKSDNDENEPDLVFKSTNNDENVDTKRLFYTNFLPVVSFYSIEDSVGLENLANYKIFAYADDVDLVLMILRINEMEEVQIESVSTDEDLAEIIMSTDNSLALIPPDRLTPELKLLTYEGEYYLESGRGGLTVDVSYYAPNDSNIPEVILETIPIHLTGLQSDKPASPDEYFSLRMTGVTAISRNLAIKIDRSGDPTYPAEHLGEFLSSADITHTSNEVSFVPGCVPEQSMRFCSALEYIKTLEVSGIDVVELTGNHNNDYGAIHNTGTIEMYTELGWDYFGGGLNDTDAAKTLYLEEKGNVVAMLGYNYYDTMLGTGALAGDQRAGANSYSVEKLQNDILEAKKTADVVIVDFQFQECYSYPESDIIYPICYRPLSYPDQRAVFRQAIDLGADIVMGTQAHQPQTYEIYKDRFIFYGLGNLYFDQISWTGTRQGLIITHYFLNGEHVQSKIDTTYLGLDMKPYLTYGEEREDFLGLLNNAR